MHERLQPSSESDQEILLTEENLAIGVQVVYMSRDCKVVGFQENKVLLHSLHTQPDGNPTSTWSVEKYILLGRPVINHLPE